MRYFVLPLLIVGLMMPFAKGAGDMAPDLQSGALWEMNNAAVFSKYVNGEMGSWVDLEKTKLRIDQPKITIGSLRLGEILMDWQDGKPHDMTIMIYNKGDNGVINRQEFESRLNAAKEAITALAGTEPKDYKPSRGDAAVKLTGWTWTWPKGAAVLESNSSKDNKQFEAEFIRLKLAPDQATLNSKDAARSTRSDLKKHVKKEGKRIVIQGVPMVDQGQKGYCAVTTAARIFAYFGMEHVDQHEIASLADTSASGGTSPEHMAANIKKIGGRFQIRVREIDNIYNQKEMARFLKAYNKAAAKLKKPQAGSLSKFWDSADGEVLKLARAGNQNQINRWVNTIRPFITAGIPVLWSVHLGLVPEPMRLSQTRGGHMRLIIGFDEEKQTLIFSDSWGAQHSEKEMPLADAIAITSMRMVMQPSR